MTNEDEIRRIVEEIDPEGKISADRIEDFVAAIKEMQANPPKDGDKIGDMTVSVLQEQINNEPDWRKKASLAAKIISLGLE